MKKIAVSFVLARALGLQTPKAQPRCKACGKPVCAHPDAVFQGVVPVQHGRHP